MPLPMLLLSCCVQDHSSLKVEKGHVVVSIVTRLLGNIIRTYESYVSNKVRFTRTNNFFSFSNVSYRTPFMMTVKNQNLSFGSYSEATMINQE